jgi:hypothetical protein
MYIDWLHMKKNKKARKQGKTSARSNLLFVSRTVGCAIGSIAEPFRYS